MIIYSTVTNAFVLYRNYWHHVISLS